MFISYTGRGFETGGPAPVESVGSVETLTTYTWLSAETVTNLVDKTVAAEPLIACHDKHVCTPGRPVQRLKLELPDPKANSVYLKTPVELSLYRSLRGFQNKLNGNFEMEKGLLDVLGMPEAGDFLNSMPDPTRGPLFEMDDFFENVGFVDATELPSTVSPLMLRFLSTIMVLRLLFVYEKSHHRFQEEQKEKSSSKKGNFQKGKGGANWKGAGNLGKVGGGKGIPNWKGAGANPTNWKGSGGGPAWLNNSEPCGGIKRMEPYIFKQYDFSDVKRFNLTNPPEQDSEEARAFMRIRALDYCLNTLWALAYSDPAEKSQLPVQESSILKTFILKLNQHNLQEFPSKIGARSLMRIVPFLGAVDTILDAMSLFGDKEAKVERVGGGSPGGTGGSSIPRAVLVPSPKPTSPTQMTGMALETQNISQPSATDLSQVPIRWSSFRLWNRLVPSISSSQFFVPRFFLVDVGIAPFTIYDVDKKYYLVTDDQKRVFVGQLEKFGEREKYNDGQRQGYHFESQVLTHCSEGNTHLLTKLKLATTGISCVYSSSPDLQDPYLVGTAEVDSSASSAGSVGDGGEEFWDPAAVWEAISEEICGTVSTDTKTASTDETANIIETPLVSFDGGRTRLDRAVSSEQDSKADQATPRDGGAAMSSSDGQIKFKGTVVKEKDFTSTKHLIENFMQGNFTAIINGLGNRSASSARHEGHGERKAVSQVGIWEYSTTTSNTLTGRDFAELKKARNLSRGNQREKKMKYWLQAHLGGIKTVIAGEETKPDSVGKLHVFKPDEDLEENASIEHNGQTSSRGLLSRADKKGCLMAIEKALEFVLRTTTPSSMWTLGLNNRGGRVNLQLAKMDAVLPPFLENTFSTES